MKGFFSLIIILSLFSSLILVGCAQEKAASSREAIELAKAMETVQPKADYLIKQARAFYNSKEFQQSIDIAQYILRAVDKDSQAAKDLLEKAKQALTQAAQGVVGGVTQKLPGFGE